jgi:anti-sigma B factor antagonist
MNTKNVTVIAPQGRLDAAGAGPLEVELKQHLTAGEVHLVVDLENARYISSNGLRVLLAAQRDAKKRGGDLKLCSLPPRVVEIFSMSGFDRVFEIYDRRDHAEKSFG